MESPSSWSNLPESIQTRIKNCLTSPSDISRFRSVCPSWRSSTPPFKFSFPFPDVLVDHRTKSNNHLSQITIYCFEPLIQPSRTSPTCWLVAVEFVARKHHFLDALKSSQTNPIPPEIPKELNLCDFEITELLKVYGVQYQHTTRKAVFISSQYHDETLLAVCSSSLVFYRLENNQWVVLKKIDDRWFTDIELYQGRVWGIDSQGRAIVFTSSLDAIEVEPRLLPDNDDETSFYFIESSGDLFILELNIIRGTRRRIIDSMLKGELLPKKIHKLVVEENRWIEVRYLDDRVFVLAREFPWSFSLPASQIPDGMGNCIVSSAISLDEYDDEVYDFIGSHPTVSSLWEIERDKYGPLFFYPGLDKMFWPPPKWLITGNTCDE